MECVSSYSSTDWEMMEKQKIGSNIQVHIDNLKSPEPSRQIRPLDYEHVESLKQIFRDSFQQAFTTLVGLVEVQPKDVKEYAEPGKAMVEVLGGNHTVAALKSLNIHKFVNMHIYKGIDDRVSLALGYSHNRLHENAKNMSFDDTVLLLRNILMSTRKQYPHEAPKKVATKWRSNICSIFGKTKNDLKNMYKVHCHLAAVEDNEWNVLVELFDAFKHGLVKQCGKSSQYAFMKYIHVPSGHERIQLLTKLAAGDMTVNQFRQKCQRLLDDKKSCSPDEGREELLRTPELDEDVCDNDRTRIYKKSNRVKQLDDCREEIESLLNILKREKELRQMALITIQKKNDKLKEKELRIVELKEDVDKLENDNKNLSKKLEKYACCIHDLMNEKKILKKKLDTEKLQCKAAEDTAARAISDNRNTYHKKQDLAGSRKRKKEDSDKEQSSIKRPVSNADDPKMTERLEQDKTSIAIVEYNRGQIYYVKLEGDEMTYCYKPFGCIKEKSFIHKPLPNSFIFNNKDKQTYDKSFVICHLEGYCRDNNILIDNLSLNLEKQLSMIKTYIKSK